MHSYIDMRWMCELQLSNYGTQSATRTIQSSFCERNDYVAFR